MPNSVANAGIVQINIRLLLVVTHIRLSLRESDTGKVLKIAVHSKEFIEAKEFQKLPPKGIRYTSKLWEICVI